MVHLETSCFEDRHTVESHRQARLESSLVSAVAEGNSHQTGRLEDGPFPTARDIES